LSVLLNYNLNWVELRELDRSVVNESLPEAQLVISFLSCGGLPVLKGW
jgi:hypothetical protein